MNQKTMRTISAKELTQMAMFTAMIAVGAWITLPIGLVGVTMQTLAVMLAGLLLPRRAAMTTVAAYLLLGILGLPIFAGGIGGPAIFGKPSFGFLLGFLPLVWMSATGTGGSQWKRMIGLFVGNIALYCAGFLYMYLYFNLFTVRPMEAAKIFQIGIFPYFPGDAVKIGLAIGLAKIAKKEFR